MTDEQAALILDPKRERYPRWWRYTFIGDNASGCTIAGDREMAESPLWQPTGEPSGNIPPITTDRVAAFTHVTPVLLAAGCCIEEYPYGVYVKTDRSVEGEPWENWQPISHYDEPADERTPAGLTYPAATTAAIAWMAEHDSERLRKAVEGIEP